MQIAKVIMAHQKSPIDLKSKLASVTNPVSVSSSNGDLRSSVSFNERLANVRNEAQQQGLDGSW